MIFPFVFLCLFPVCFCFCFFLLGFVRFFFCFFCLCQLVFFSGIFCCDYFVIIFMFFCPLKLRCLSMVSMFSHIRSLILAIPIVKFFNLLAALCLLYLFCPSPEHLSSFRKFYTTTLRNFVEIREIARYFPLLYKKQSVFRIRKISLKAATFTAI